MHALQRLCFPKLASDGAQKTHRNGMHMELTGQHSGAPPTSARGSFALLFLLRKVRRGRPRESFETILTAKTGCLCMALSLLITFRVAASDTPIRKIRRAPLDGNQIQTQCVSNSDGVRAHSVFLRISNTSSFGGRGLLLGLFPPRNSVETLDFLATAL